MMHTNRVWCVHEAESTEVLAQQLSEEVWVLCNGVFVRGHPDYLFLNDATCEDGAAEYAVIKGGLGAERHRQIESITFSWCTPDSALAHILRALRGEDDNNDFAYDVTLRLETPEEHGRCIRCM